MKSLTCLIVTLALSLVAQSQPAKPDYANTLAAKLEPTKLVTYLKTPQRELRLHVFNPADLKPGDKRPCFVTIHGGGWGGGEPRRMYPFAAHFAAKGMVGISIEYRLTRRDKVAPYDCVADGRAALRYIKAHAAELGIDPAKIAVSGGSAGGHVAAGTAMFDAFNAPTDDVKVDPTPAALILYYPVIDTSPAGYGNKACGERWREISPLHQVKKGTPPTIVFHGTADKTTPYAGAKAFDAAMRAAGNTCELVTNEGGAHGYLMFEKTVYDEAIAKTEAFLEKVWGK
ncbi:MAG TPA: alpha/beta hydrolase [Tepidisphaeraceae bacterium]|nr:alpha/beta hydrolase [Tepidisphaeraceae bacterium]